jgi:hypothetical protein
VLIDIIGTFNGGTLILLPITLRRKAAVTGPNTTFNISWDSYSADTCNNLGSRIAVKVPKELTVDS